jgi:hypothetical protein
MKFEFLIFGLTFFFIANTYYDGKYIEIIKSWKKYYQMMGIAFVGISFYAFIKKHPNQFNSLAGNAHNLIKFLPIDKEASDMISPLFDMSNPYTKIPPQQKRMMNSGCNSSKRSVSETKKKFVASQQNWKCEHCRQQLPAWFEVDHKVRLDQGGSNHVDNLVALCRNCHGRKTSIENL